MKTFNSFNQLAQANGAPSTLLSPMSSFNHSVYGMGDTEDMERFRNHLIGCTADLRKYDKGLAESVAPEQLAGLKATAEKNLNEISEGAQYAQAAYDKTMQNGNQTAKNKAANFQKEITELLATVQQKAKEVGL